MTAVESINARHISISAVNDASFHVELPEPIELYSHAQILSYFPQTISEIEAYKNEAKANIEKGLNSTLNLLPEQRDFENTFYAMDFHLAQLHSKVQALHIVASTHPKREIRDAAKSAKDELHAFRITNIDCNRGLYQVFQCAYKIIQRGNYLTEQQREYVDSKMHSLKKEGFELNNEDFEVLRELKVRINVLESVFLKNLDEDNSHFWVEIEELRGVPSCIVSNLEQSENKVKVSCDYPVYSSILDHCEIESTRKKIFIAFNNRASETNIPILKELISLRDTLAKILGFSSFAEYDIDGQMANSPERVEAFIHKIISAFQQKASAEIDNLLSEFPDHIRLTAEGKINPWDIHYLYNGAKSFEETEIQKYFPCNATLDKLFKIYGSLFDLEFREANSKRFWDPTVKLVAVYEKNNRLLGHIVLDLFPREGKFGHCYCVDVLAPLHEKPALAVVLANLSTGNLDYEDVQTLFHELGHALHQLLGAAEMPTLSGYHTKTDFLELPSLLMEELLWDPAVLEQLSEHYETKKPLPKQLIEAKIASRNHGRNHFHLDQMLKASLSLEYFKSGFNKNPKLLREELEQRIIPYLATCSESHYEGTFRHLADSLYRSKYYCYHWAEVFARDVFVYIQNQSDREKPWLRYRKQILAAGGGTDPNILLQRFLGREPSEGAFLTF